MRQKCRRFGSPPLAEGPLGGPPASARRSGRPRPAVFDSMPRAPCGIRGMDSVRGRRLFGESPLVASSSGRDLGGVALLRSREARNCFVRSVAPPHGGCLFAADCGALAPLAARRFQVPPGLATLRSCRHDAPGSRSGRTVRGGRIVACSSFSRGERLSASAGACALRAPHGGSRPRILRPEGQGSSSRSPSRSLPSGRARHGAGRPRSSRTFARRGDPPGLSPEGGGLRCTRPLGIRPTGVPCASVLRYARHAHPPMNEGV